MRTDVQVPFDVDMREFNAALRSYATASTKELSDIINQKMFFITRGAHRLTPKVDRAKVEAELGVIAYRVSRSKKTGQFKKRNAIIGGTRLIYAIVNARRRRAGQPGLQKQEMKKAARNLLANRFRGIGTLKAGWVSAIRTFAKAAKMPISIGGVPVKGKAQSVVAKPSFNPKAEVTYNVTSFDTNHKPYIDQRTVSALAQAFRDEAASMAQYVASKMQKLTNKYNAK